MPKKNNKNAVFLPWLHDETFRQKDKNGNYEKVKRFVGVPHSLLQNKKFRSLNPNAMKLYLYMLDWACGQQNITFPWSLGSKIIKSNKTFIKAIDNLEKMGFIEIIEKGSFNHRPNKYRFSVKWKYNE